MAMSYWRVVSAGCTLYTNRIPEKTWTKLSEQSKESEHDNFCQQGILITQATNDPIID